MKQTNRNFLGSMLDEAIHPEIKIENITKGRIVKMNLLSSDGLHIKSGTENDYCAVFKLLKETDVISTEDKKRYGLL